MLKGKNILIGICGGIAAYKVCDLVSRLKKRDMNIDVIMTAASVNFVNPLTFQSLTSNKVVMNMFETSYHNEIQHISLAKKADVVLIAPATANIIGKIANGIADDMLTTTVMATKAPIIMAPAMNSNMFENSILQENILKLKNKGFAFIEPTEGRLACGDIGKGKMAEPEDMEKYIESLFMQTSQLKGKTVIVTAGPTQEAIDPVRYITNHSTGKMGYAIAEKAILRGADVYLVSGPTTLKPPKGVKLINVKSALEMYEKVMGIYEKADIVIKSAAVADYASAEFTNQKIKKGGDNLTIKLKKNPDILFELGKNKGNKVLVGFAMETQNLIENAKDKIIKKNLDFIVANDLETEGAGFASDTNVVKIIFKTGIIESIPIMSKLDLADIILDKVISVLNEKSLF